MRYSVENRDRIWKPMDFCLLLKMWVKILIKIQVKIEVVNIVRNFLIMLNNILQIHLKLLKKSDSKNSRSNW